MDDYKRCARCKQLKLRAEFPPSKQQRDGLFPYCRPCNRAVQRADYAKHAESRSAKAKARYAANPEPIKARSRAQYYADPERWKASTIAWQRANPDKRRVTTRKWQQANMQGLVRESVRRRAATRKGAPSIKFTPAQLAQRAAYYGHRCWICRDAMTEWDHVKPITKGGWHCLANLRPICRSCNAHKRNKWPFVVTIGAHDDNEEDRRRAS